MLWCFALFLFVLFLCVLLGLRGPNSKRNITINLSKLYRSAFIQCPMLRKTLLILMVCFLLLKLQESLGPKSAVSASRQTVVRGQTVPKSVLCHVLGVCGKPWTALAGAVAQVCSPLLPQTQ